MSLESFSLFKDTVRPTLKNVARSGAAGLTVPETILEHLCYFVKGVREILRLGGEGG